MNISNKLTGLLTIFVLLGTATAQEVSATHLSFADIVARLYDAKYLATPPVVGENSGCFSTFEKTSRYNPETGKYENWFANADSNGVYDGDGKGPSGVLFEMDGPGVIWRIWSAQPRQNGDIEIYIDGASEPVLKMPFIDIFKYLNQNGNPHEPLYPELNHVKGRGLNTFIPISFEKSIVIKGVGDWGRYCQITYTTFPDGTSIPSFKGSYTDAEHEALAKANTIWGKRGPGLFASGDTKMGTASIKPGGKEVLAEWNHPAAITSLVLTLPELDPEQAVSILRELTVSIYWDGEEDPSVWAPLGDFFGNAGGLTLYRSLMTGVVEENGKNVFYANWYMPFGSAKIVIGNDGAEARELDFEIQTAELTTSAEDVNRFHCKWHRDDFSGFDEDRLWQDRWPDWPVLKIEGASGRFCGFMAHMWNPNHPWNREHRHFHERPVPTQGVFQNPNSDQYKFYQQQVIPRNYWWGEGDEKFFVDGENMPSTYGTGTEDYFGYAWGSAQAFDSALQAQVRNGGADVIGESAPNDGPGNIGHIVNLRWQVPDNVPFQESFEATIEKYHPNSWPLLNAYTIVWYQQAGTSDHYKPRPLAERDGYYVPAKLRALRPVVNGRYEGGDPDHLRIGNIKEASVNVQDMARFGKEWSNDSQWLFRFHKPEAEATLIFDVPTPVRGLTLSLTTAPDYGKANIMLDGNVIAEGVDCYANTVTVRESISLPEITLSAGSHQLTFISAGKNPQSEGIYLGLNFLKIGEDNE